MACGFNAFANHGHSEDVGHCDHRGDDLALPPVGFYAFHEAAVDLEDVDRELPKVRERGVPGAEVVKRDVYSECGEFLEGRPCIGVLDEGGFGYLEA